MQLGNIQNYMCPLNRSDLTCRGSQPAPGLKIQPPQISKEGKLLSDLCTLADRGDINAKIELDRRAYMSLAGDKSHADAKMTCNSVQTEGIAAKPNAQPQASKDEANVLPYFKRAAELGGALAQYGYANMLYFGESTDSDKKEALSYYKLAADQRLPVAQFIYAAMRYFGQGAEKNQAEALRYFKLAADEGLTVAQYNYAAMRYSGQGGEKNETEALNYFKLAASEGLAIAQDRYDSLNYAGKGAEQNRAFAYDLIGRETGQGARPKISPPSEFNCPRPLAIEEARAHVDRKGDKGLIKSGLAFGLDVKLDFAQDLMVSEKVDTFLFYTYSAFFGSLGALGAITIAIALKNAIQLGFAGGPVAAPVMANP